MTGGAAPGAGRPWIRNVSLVAHIGGVKNPTNALLCRLTGYCAGCMITQSAG